MLSMIVNAVKSSIPNKQKRRIKLFCLNLIQTAQYQIFHGNIFSDKPCHPKHFVFVCKGNVCRSSFAEVLSKKYFGYDAHLSFDSCGLDVDQGDYPPGDAIAAAKSYGCDQALANRKAKGLAECDFVNADLILPMEFDQYIRLCKLYPEQTKNIRLLRDYAPGKMKLFCNIDDPYSWGCTEFDRVFYQLDKSIKKLV